MVAQASRLRVQAASRRNAPGRCSNPQPRRLRHRIGRSAASLPPGGKYQAAQDGAPGGGAGSQFVRDRSVATVAQALPRQATDVRPADAQGTIQAGLSCRQDESLYAKDGMFCAQDESLYAEDGIYSAQDWQLYAEDGIYSAQDWQLYAEDGMDLTQEWSSGGEAKALCPL